MKFAIILIGKAISVLSKSLGFGNGSTWPGQFALNIDKNFIKHFLKKPSFEIILITGTNGKTTTSKMIETILNSCGKKVFSNSSGANLLNGVASSLIINSDLSGKINADYAIFETDENTVPLIVNQIEPNYIVTLNLFRDQLDRYGEIDTIAKKWHEAYKKLTKTTFILNADDSQVAYLGNNLKSKVYYFGLNEKISGHKNHEHASDSILCPNCGKKLIFESYYFSHLGKWHCNNCGLKRPDISISNTGYYPITGTYGKYDTNAAWLLAKTLGIEENKIYKGLRNFTPAFGRQETLSVGGKLIKFFLSKNPTSFNESLRTINESNVKNLLIILNDQIPDGTDVSWIWDIDFETLVNEKINLYLAGDRVYDLAIRFKYAGIKINEKNIFESLENAISAGIKNTKSSEIFYILPTYSAMLDARKILTGKKIL